MESLEIKRARQAAAAMIAPTSRTVLLWLGLALASDAGAAAAGADRVAGQHSDAPECAEGVSRTDCALWQAYRGCVSRADHQRITGDVRGEFIVRCAARRATDAGVNEGRYTQCRARADHFRLTGADFEDYLDWCGLETRKEGTANARGWDRQRTCYARASAEHMTGDGRRAFLDACLAEYRARDLPQLAGSPAGAHPRETW